MQFYVNSFETVKDLKRKVSIGRILNVSVARRWKSRRSAVKRSVWARKAQALAKTFHISPN